MSFSRDYAVFFPISSTSNPLRKQLFWRSGRIGNSFRNYFIFTKNSLSFLVKCDKI